MQYAGACHCCKLTLAIWVKDCNDLWLNHSLV